MGSFLAVGANLLFINLTLAELQHRAIALSTSLSMMVNLLFLGIMLFRMVQGFRVGYIMASLAKVTAVSFVMAVLVHLGYHWLTGWLGKGLTGQLLSLALVIPGGAGLYVVFVSRLGIREFQDLAADLRSRLMR